MMFVESPLDVRQHRRLPRLTFQNVLIFGVFLGIGFLAPSFGPGIVPVDALILVMIVLWVPSIADGEPRGVLRPLLIPLALILAGSLLGSMAVGIKPWIITDLAKDVASFASFFAVIVVLRSGGPSTLRAAGWASALATIIVCLALIVDVGSRAQATFANPNIAAHYLVTSLVVLTRVPIPRVLRFGTIAIGAIGLAVTGSFGALLMSLGAFGYLAVSLPQARRRVLVKRAALVGIFVLGIVMIVSGGGALTPDTETGFNERHFERSSEGRFGKWTAAVDVAIENPLGIGPGSNRGLGLLPGDQEAHNEYLAYLSERSLVGLIGLILLYLGMWRLGPRGGLTRALVIGFALQSLVRETFHYRHLWLVLGLAFVLDTGLDEAAPSQDPSLEEVSA